MYCANPVMPYCIDPTTTALPTTAAPTTTAVATTTTASAGVDACVDSPVDIAFVLDASGSIGSSRYNNMKTEVGNIVAGLDVSADMVQVSATTFSDQTDHTGQESGFFLNEHYGDANVQAAIDALPYHGSTTYTGTALQWTIDNVLSAANGRRGGDVPAVIVIITDGAPSNSAQQALAAAEAAAVRAAGVRIFAIGVGGTYNVQNLLQMASQPHSEYVYELDGFDVTTFKDELLTEICNETATTTALPTTAAPTTAAPTTTAVATTTAASLRALVGRTVGR